MSQSRLSHTGRSGQMSATIASDAKAPRNTSFAPLGLPAVMAAAEILKPRKTTERPQHQSFFVRGDD